MNLLFILIQLILFILIYLTIIFIINKYNTRKIYSKKLFISIEENICKLKGSNHYLKTIKILTPFNVVILSFLLFLFVFILLYSFFKMFVYSVIMSIPFSCIPYFLLKFQVQEEKNKIRKILPIYAVNLKGQMSTENNIILAIKRTKVEQPLQKYIFKFIMNIDRGMNVIEAFEALKKEVNIEEFTELISAFQVCYQNGGMFENILQTYSKQVSNALMIEEKEKEKTMSSVITLIVMLVLNIFLVVSYIFGNKEFTDIIRKSLIGDIVMIVNGLSCILCIYFLYKMYKLEE